MSRHRNVRKLNIEEELEEDDDDFYEEDEEDEAVTPETSKFLYKRPGFPQPAQSSTGSRQQLPPIAKESERRNGDEFEQMDEKETISRPKPPPPITKSSPTKQQQPQQKSSPAMAIPPVVENLRIDESTKHRASSKSPGRTATPKQTLSNLELALAATPKYRQRQRPADTQPALNLVIVGHVDAGKSTMVGHLLYLLGNVDERSMHRYRQDSSRLGKSSFAYAWILDESEEERTRGVTMDIARINFETASGRKFHILDAPGHKDFIPNMITGAAQADAALLVVNATRGEFETGFDQGGQTREHAMLVRALGVSRLVVAVNKLDTCDWSQQRFDELCSILSSFLLRRAGFEQIKFVPVSGLHGINLTQKPATNHPLAEWYSQGPTLVEALEWLPLPAVVANSPGENPPPMRAIVNEILRTAPGTLVLTAKLESGHIETGDKLFLMPEANPVTVKVISIDEPSSMRGGSASTSAISSLAASKSADQQQVCFAGDQAILTLTGAFEPDSVFPGHVLCRGGTELLLPCRQFRCQLVTFDIRMPILRGTRAELFIHSLRVPCVVSQLFLMHPGGGEQEKRNPRFLPRNVSAIVEIRTEQPISVEPFGRQKQLGRVALRAAGETIAAGIVLDSSTSN